MNAPLPPLPPIGGNVARPPRVKFRHPGYSPETPPILILYATDDGCNALDFDLALAACGIVTDTSPGYGYLALKGGGNGVYLRQDRPADGLLRGREYFFCLENREPTYKYPIVPSFQHWRFPHNNLPPPWRDLHIPNNYTGPVGLDSRSRDNSCQITAYRNALDGAHVVPKAETLWFTSNDMDRYCAPSQAFPVNDAGNIIALRKDLYFLFDSHRFTFVPKRFGPTPDPNPKLVLHVLLPCEFSELVQLYQNLGLQPVYGISVEFLFARFAWSLFTDEHIQFFRLPDDDYEVRLWDRATAAAVTKGIKGSAVGTYSQVFAPQKSNQSRSISAKKRSPSSGDRLGMLRGGGELLGDGSEGADSGVGWSGREDLEELTRGRPRERAWDMEKSTGIMY